jgi:F-type H+-transporting ATPase subunit alpha
MSLAKQVILLCAASHKLLIDVPAEHLEAFKDGLMDYMAQHAPGVIQSIHETRKLEEEMETAVVEAVTAFKEGWSHE